MIFNATNMNRISSILDIFQSFPGEKYNHENMLKAIIEGNFERNNNLSPQLLLPQMPYDIADINRNAFNKRNVDPLNLNNFKPGGLNNCEYNCRSKI